VPSFQSDDSLNGRDRLHPATDTVHPSPIARDLEAGGSLSFLTGRDHIPQSENGNRVRNLSGRNIDPV
jgi:hypothetical protein